MLNYWLSESGSHRSTIDIFFLLPFNLMSPHIDRYFFALFEFSINQKGCIKKGEVKFNYVGDAPCAIPII